MDKKTASRSLPFFGRGTIGNCQQSYGSPSVANGLSHGLKIAQRFAIFTPVYTLVPPFQVLASAKKDAFAVFAYEFELSHKWYIATRYDIRRCRMIYLLCKHDVISVPSYAEGIYHRAQSDIISKIYHPFRKERISLKNGELYYQVQHSKK